MVSAWASIHGQVVVYAGSDFNFNRPVFEYMAMGRYAEVKQVRWRTMLSLSSSCLCSEAHEQCSRIWLTPRRAISNKWNNDSHPLFSVLVICCVNVPLHSKEFGVLLPQTLICLTGGQSVNIGPTLTVISQLDKYIQFT